MSVVRVYADNASDELWARYAFDPRPDLCYALGQAERKRGNCKAAVGWYQRYVDSGPSAQRTVATLVQIDRCKQEMAAAAAPPSATAPQPTPPPVQPPPTVVEPPPAPPPPTSAS